MDDQWIARMDEATPFEAGEVCQSAAYHQAARTRSTLGRALWAVIPQKAETLLDDYLDATDDLTEFEVMHYFQEGYRLGLQAATISNPGSAVLSVSRRIKAPQGSPEAPLWEGVVAAGD